LSDKGVEDPVGEMKEEVPLKLEWAGLGIGDHYSVGGRA